MTSTGPTVSSLNTLLIFLIGFGSIGVARGPRREIWTLCGITVAILFLSLGGVEIVKQLPIRVAAGFLAMSGNQDASNSTASHPMGDPWPGIMLWVSTLALVAIAYLMALLGKKEEKRDFGNYASGFLMGALNGAFICVFLFSQGGFNDLTIKFPDGPTARTVIAPLILIGLAVVFIAIMAMRPKPASSSGSGKATT